MDGFAEMTVDVIIPVYKPKDDLLKLLWMLKKQSRQPGKIILMITESEGYEYPDLSTFDNVEIHTLTEREFDHGGTRNLAVTYSKADFVLFITQDAEPKNTHFVETLLAGLQSHENTGATYARQLPKPDAGPIETFVRSFNYPAQSELKTKASLTERGIKTYFCSNVAAMYDRKVLTKLGGFPDPTIFNEDMIFASKLINAGYAIYYNADAQVYHSHDLSGKQQFRRNFDLGVSQADHPEIFQAVSSESEGKKLVMFVAKSLIREGKGFYIFPFLYQCGMKYFGFRKGKQYKKLSEKRVRRFSSNQYYWERYYGTDHR